MFARELGLGAEAKAAVLGESAQRLWFSRRCVQGRAQKSSAIGFPAPTMLTGRPEASGKWRSIGMPSDL